MPSIEWNVVHFSLLNLALWLLIGIWVEQLRLTNRVVGCFQNFLQRLGYQHDTVNHSKGEYARGQVHVNTVEGVWSLLRDQLRIHRGVSKLY